MIRAQFINNCVGTLEHEVDALHAMIDGAEEISRRQFLNRVDREQMRSLEQELGYGRKSGLTMAADWHVNYFRSLWQGRPAYFFCWSAIEYYFA